MQHALRVEDEVIIATITGEFYGSDLLTDETTGPLVTDVRNAYSPSTRGVVLDLGKVRHMNSTALGDLAGLATAIQRRGGQLALVGVSGKSIPNLFLVTKLVFLFPTYTSIADAKLAIGTPA